MGWLAAGVPALPPRFIQNSADSTLCITVGSDASCAANGPMFRVTSCSAATGTTGGLAYAPYFGDLAVSLGQYSLYASDWAAGNTCDSGKPCGWVNSCGVSGTTTLVTGKAVSLTGCACDGPLVTYSAPGQFAVAWTSGGPMRSSVDNTACLDYTAASELYWTACSAATRQNWVYSPAPTLPAVTPTVPPLATAIVTARGAPYAWAVSSGALANTGSATAGAAALYGSAAFLSRPAAVYLPPSSAACVPSLALQGGAFTVALWVFVNQATSQAYPQNLFTVLKGSSCRCVTSHAAPAQPPPWLPPASSQWCLLVSGYLSPTVFPCAAATSRRSRLPRTST